MAKRSSNDKKIIAMIIIFFGLSVWFCTPPGNKFLQMCFLGNNTKLLIAIITDKSETTAYKFYRNNAIYLAKMDKRKSYKDRAVVEMTKAIRSYPSYMPDTGLQKLYKESAYLKIYAGNYKGALDDFINSKNIAPEDYFKFALLLNKAGMYQYAQSYCNAVLNKDITALQGYACLSDVYTSQGKYESAITVWSLFLDRKANNSTAYLERAKVKKSIGDIAGYEEDLKKAKQYNPYINENTSLVEETLHPAILTLSID